MENVFRKEYMVVNSVMDSQFRLSAKGMQLIAQDCFASMMAQHHVAAFDLQQRGLMWILSEFHMIFSGQTPFWGETLTVEAWLAEKPTVKVHIGYRLVYKGQEFASGDSDWAILDVESRKPVLASKILQELEAATGVPAPVRHRIPKSDSPMPILLEHRAVQSDTDFNLHVSNITYMRMALDAVPHAYWQGHSLERLTLTFVHESFLGSMLHCRASVLENDQWLMELSLEDGTVCSRALAEFAEKTASESMDVASADLEIRKK